MQDRVSLGFANLPDPGLDGFAQGVIDRMTGNAAFPTPPVTMPNLQTARNEFTSGQLVARVDPVKNASMYEGRIKGPNGDWMPSIFTGDSQHITFTGLAPGATYTIEVRALGGSTGQSDWSDPSSHMSM